jgi:shikimate dehydrogenase
VCNSLQPVVALFGLPVAGNPTQFMMEKAFQHHQLDWRYLSLDVPPDSLADALRGLRAMGFRGCNLTEPHKQPAAECLNRLTETARRTAVVNCVRREANDLVGENTEGLGFLQALRRRIDPAGKRAVVLGAGRMARAVIVELALAKAGEILVVGRNEPNGRAAADLAVSLGTPASCAPWSEPFAVPADVGVLVDATAPGPHGLDAPVALALDQLARETVVADVSFNPPRTWLLHQAAERGCPTIDGLEMFAEQAAANFLLWTGVDPDRTVLREAAEEFLEV